VRVGAASSAPASALPSVLPELGECVLDAVPPLEAVGPVLDAVPEPEVIPPLPVPFAEPLPGLEHAGAKSVAARTTLRSEPGESAMVMRGIVMGDEIRGRKGGGSRDLPESRAIAIFGEQTRTPRSSLRRASCVLQPICGVRRANDAAFGVRVVNRRLTPVPTG
jgi:hypothetical protein